MFDARPLIWDDTLSERAQAWAIYLSSRQVSDYHYKHSKYIQRKYFARKFYNNKRFIKNKSSRSPEAELHDFCNNNIILRNI